MLKASGFALVSLLLPAAAVAGIEGVYDAGDCSDPHSDGRVRVTADAIEFYESRCQLENATPLRGFDAAVLYDKVCSGEGETWTDRILLMPEGEAGLLRVENGFSLRYQRCE